MYDICYIYIYIYTILIMMKLQMFERLDIHIIKVAIIKINVDAILINKIIIIICLY